MAISAGLLKQKAQSWIIISFWQKRTIFHKILLPLALLYSFLQRHVFNFQVPQKVKKAKIICVGNISVGGNGKTPTCISLAKYLQNQGNGKKIAFVTKGYGKKGRLMRNVIVLNNRQFGQVTNQDFTANTILPPNYNFLEVGDEAILLSKIAPTYVSDNRLLAATKASIDGADTIILDDGLQDNSIYKDLNIVVIGNNAKLGNQYVLPIGPLRESISFAMQRVDVVSFINNDASSFDWATELNAYIQPLSSKPYRQIKGTITTTNQNKIISLCNKNIVGIVSIAYPEKFISVAQSMGIRFSKIFKFPDHYMYTAHDLAMIDEYASSIDAVILTTEKDLVKIPSRYHHNVHSLNVELQIPWDELHSLLS